MADVAKLLFKDAIRAGALYFRANCRLVLNDGAG